MFSRVNSAWSVYWILVHFFGKPKRANAIALNLFQLTDKTWTLISKKKIPAGLYILVSLITRREIEYYTLYIFLFIFRMNKNQLNFKMICHSHLYRQPKPKFYKQFIPPHNFTNNAGKKYSWIPLRIRHVVPNLNWLNREKFYSKIIKCCGFLQFSAIACRSFFLAESECTYERFVLAIRMEMAPTLG